jgi:hypothetical protein
MGIYHDRLLSSLFSGLPQCYNPNSPLCSSCSQIELILGTCLALGNSDADKGLGFITGWGMFACFWIIIFGVVSSRTSWFWAGFAPIWGIIVGSICQALVPSIRPPGACMYGGTSCGMPSGHCSTAYACASYLLLAISCKIYKNGFSKFITKYKSPLNFTWFCTVCIFLCIQLLMAFGRVVIYYHTIEQVGYGFLTGVLIGGFWFLLVHFFFGPTVGSWMVRKLTCLKIKDDWNDESVINKDEVVKSPV